MNPYIMTSSGRKFHLLDMAENVFDIDEIADALSKLCRFTGHTSKFYSVAEHSVRVARSVPLAHRVAALLHDAPEAYLGDVASPLRSVLPDYNAVYSHVERWMQDCAAYAFSVRDVNFSHPVVKKADRDMFEIEAPYLLPRANWAIETPFKDCPRVGWFWTPEEARREFLATFAALV